jgi:hypothetical protein
MQALAPTVTDTNLRPSATSRAAAAQAAAEPSNDSDEEDEEAPSNAAFGPWFGHPDEWDIVFCLDGDSSPLAAIIDKDKMAKHGKRSLVDIIRRNAATWGVVKFLKWAAACTPLQSPNDVGKTHMIGRRHVKGTAKKPTQPLPLEDCSDNLRDCYARLFEKSDSMEFIIAKKRKQEIWRMLSNLPITIGEAFRPKLIRDSWQKSGYIPLDTLVILSKCSLWDGSVTFSPEQKRELIDNIPLLFPYVELRGRVSDLEMETVFPFLPALEKAPVHDLAQLAVNRDRCCIVTHPGYFEGRVAAVRVALAGNPNLKPRAPPKAKKVVEAYTIYTAEIAGKFNVDDIKHQLDIRGVTWGPHCKKKAAFVQLWLDNSALPDKRVALSAVDSLAANLQRLHNLQAAVPPSPRPRAAIAASAPSTPLTPRRQAALRVAGLQ